MELRAEQSQEQDRNYDLCPNGTRAPAGDMSIWRPHCQTVVRTYHCTATEFASL